MTKWFHEIKDDDFDLVGGKAFNLGKLTRLGFDVPKGFVLTADVYEHFINFNSFAENINEILKLNQSALEKSQAIQALFDNGKIDSLTRDAVLMAYKNLETDSVAVRSSSTAEDLEEMSFAGQYDTFLNVKESDLLTQIINCWKSLWNESAITYRNKHFNEKTFSHCVIVQEMVTPTVSGVIFTANPLSNNRRELLINLVSGLGEALVSGEVMPEQYTLNKDTGQIIQASKDLLLSAKQLKTLRETANKIHASYDHAQDIEFSFDGDQLFILQTRAITTLYPIDNLEHDDKLRAYLAASSVMLGMKEAFTPLGANLYGGMYPAMINKMLYPKVPVTDSFVKYESCRIFVDLTYLLSNKMISKQLGKAFSGSDLPLEATVDALIEKHGYRFRHQGIKFKIPFGITKYATTAIKRYLKARKVPTNERNQIIRDLGDEFYDTIHKGAKGLKTASERWIYCEKIMLEVFDLTQRQAWYCIEVSNLARIEKVMKKYFPDQYNLDVLSYVFPECITVEFNLAMNELAEYYDTHNITPSVLEPKFIAFLNRFGHRSTIELDFGTKRWSEDPNYLLNQIESYIEDKNYQSNLSDYKEKQDEVDEMIADIYNKTLDLKGRKKAETLKKMILDYRRASGMREYPKFNIVQGLDLARKLMLEQGTLYAKTNLINEAEDIFFLHKSEICSATIDKNLIQQRKINYEKELKRNSIPRILMNTGETFYSAQKFDPTAKLLSGISLSSGTVEGTIRIVTDPLTASLNVGDIMVAESTNPAWTPLFMQAAGLILEYGGPLSHGGIVARELGIPAVVGISAQSSNLKDGQRVRVNGEMGTVEIL